jgi:hypothetical protein
MVWIGGRRNRRQGLFLHDPPPGYHAPRSRMSEAERARKMRQEWLLEHILVVVLVPVAVAVVVIIVLMAAGMH